MSITAALRSTAFKILTRPQYNLFRTHHRLSPSTVPVDAKDGYIHLSTASTAGETFTKYFSDASDLVVLEVQLEKLGNSIKWEKSRGGELFPHVYGEGGVPEEVVGRVWEGGDVNKGLFERLNEEKE
jgi:uncharacterized protein (DUF952 family)